MAEPADINVDELRRRARRRLVGAVVLALAAAVIVPMLLESDPKPLGEDVSVRIPPVDDGKFENRLGQTPGKTDPKAARPGDGVAPKESTAKEAANVIAPAPAPVAIGTPPASIAKDAGRAPGGEVGKSDAPGTGVESPAATVTSSGSSESAKAAASDNAVSASKGKYDTRLPDGAASGNEVAPARAASDKKASPVASGSAPKSSTATASPATSATKPADAARTTVAKADEATSPSAPPKGDIAKDAFSVQLAAFADDKGANALSGKLKRAGYAAYIEPLKTSHGTLWRVRVGPFASRDAAVAVRDKLKGEGQSGIVAPTH